MGKGVVFSRLGLAFHVAQQGEIFGPFGLLVVLSFHYQKGDGGMSECVSLRILLI
jgi:membrane associated rhomboid family serine protease